MRLESMVGRKITKVQTSRGANHNDIRSIIIEFDDNTALSVSQRFIEGFGWVPFFVEYNEKI